MACLLLAALAQNREACEVRIYLREPDGSPASLRGVSAFVVLPGKAGQLGISIPAVPEVSGRDEPVPARAQPLQSRPVDGTPYRADVVVFRRRLAEEPGGVSGDRRRPGPYFRTVIDPARLDPEGTFWIVLTIGHRQHVVKGFSCHGAAQAREAVRKAAGVLERAIDARDADRARSALDVLRARLTRMPAGAPCRETCLRSCGELRSAIEAENWEQARASVEACLASCAERAEREEAAPAEERRKP